MTSRVRVSASATAVYIDAVGCCGSDGVRSAEGIGPFRTASASPLLVSDMLDVVGLQWYLREYARHAVSWSEVCVSLPG